MISASGIFITFSGNCKAALQFYQSCFGGSLHFETFDEELKGYTQKPVINGSLISETIVIHGSDMVSEEGRKIGNYLAIFLLCEDSEHRKKLSNRLGSQRNSLSIVSYDEEKLIELTDSFNVRWMLGI